MGGKLHTKTRGVCGRVYGPCVGPDWVREWVARVEGMAWQIDCRHEKEHVALSQLHVFPAESWPTSLNNPHLAESSLANDSEELKIVDG